MTDVPPLAALALAQGDTVRFRRGERRHWHQAVVVGRERDGSVKVRDAKGATRSLPAERLEVRTTRPPEPARWEPVLHRAARPEQLPLL